MTTPYEAHKIANQVFAENGIKSIPPQMLYNYTSAKLNAGKKPLIKYDRKSGVDAEDLQRWIKSYVAKKLATSTEEVEASK